MNKQMCKRFKDVREWISDELKGKENYEIKDDTPLNNYSCNINNNCQRDFDKISAGCLYLLDEFIKDCGVNSSPVKNIINIVDYILIWLSYMLNLTNSEGESNITCFCREYIYYCDKYNNKINELTDYDNYKDLLDKKNYVLNMDSYDVPKFYEAFKLLCEMYTEFDEKKKDCTNCSEKASQFVEKYKKLYKDHITKDSSYSKVLCTLSNDYDNFKKKYNESDCCESSPLPTIEKEKIPEICFEQTAQISEDTSSSSSIASKLIPVLLIFAAIPIFLGIAYKYSLFGFRKRFKKQYLREKINNIKKKMNH
ncbi:uncharacterized protein PY17X_0800700 [Plasmodium yoelii]|uniref:PIR protein n=3 Tax=Plasmodium yoelii TaxID=5861 RepID=A0AAE9WPU3_PLAYO|nr:uncharacterized protein PY17X_0800700 [Plasmodium yoelii]EAA19038.1 putative yir4 protein [Plasmodium yoelii yoelii]WBY56510.1 PIR protein [Plasmodium yoelii yoelii]CDU17373.1 YIR protein [Plasmodium yoelii]VTZ77022.1 PIR protein [Plasmodium yoelii]|eukprot:XP_727473.1 uncharacterized protein PY17X_0800700 [Plasmodium yoelii]